MKVEFTEMDPWGATLLIEETEFKKAKDDESEFMSLCAATASFAAFFDIDYHIERREYERILSSLGKKGAVYFTISELDRNPAGVEITVSNKNKLEKIISYDQRGYHFVVHNLSKEHIDEARKQIYERHKNM